MKKHYLNIISIVVSFIAVFFSCFVFFCTDIDVSASDWTLTAFSTIITILIGWQVIQYVYQKSTIRGIIDKELHVYEAKTDFLLNKQLFQSLGQLGIAIYYQENPELYAIVCQTYFNALACWDDKMKDDKSANEGYDTITSHLREIEKFANAHQCVFSSSDKESYKLFIKSALKTKDDEIISLAMRFKHSC